MADDLSIKLSDFSGSATDDLEHLVEEEDRYRLPPWTRRSFKTDIFALGCLIFEISSGRRPYDEIEDHRHKEIEELYAAQIFPPTDGPKYQAVIQKCWTCQYSSVDQVALDIVCIRRSGQK